MEGLLGWLVLVMGIGLGVASWWIISALQDVVAELAELRGEVTNFKKPLDSVMATAEKLLELRGLIETREKTRVALENELQATGRHWRDV